MITLLKSILVLYLSFAVMMTVFQRSFIYQPFQYDSYPIAEFRGNSVEIYETEGLQWLWMPTGKTPRHILVYFHGNIWSAYGRREKAEEWRERGFDVMLVEYLGYGPRDGKPSEQAFYDTGRIVVSALQKDFPDTRVSLYGESLGTGVAVQMATEFDVKGVAMETAPLSIERVSQDQYPFLPVSLRLQDKFFNDRKINEIQADLFIIHGTNDRVIPFFHGQYLYNFYEEPKQFYLMEWAGHNDLYDRTDMTPYLMILLGGFINLASMGFIGGGV